MNIVRYIIFACLGMAAIPAVAQINFMQGSLEEALKKAAAEKKALFVDFYTQWCGPCKLMARDIFPLPEVGDYFNARFVSIQLDAEAPENKEAVKKYGVNAYPWMVFLDAGGNRLRLLRGAVGPSKLIYEAKVAVGEELTFEQLYDKYKKNKKDYDNTRKMLLQAGDFVTGQKGYEREKWAVRIESVFEEYVKNKGLKNMVNAEDFFLLTLYHPTITKNDPVFDFMVEHYADFAKILGKEELSQYLIGLNNGQIIKLCKERNLDYKKRLERLDGDFADIYADIKFGSLSVKEAVTLLADATYYLYRKDEDRFFEHIDRYFAGVGESLTVNDYTQPIEDLYTLYQGQISDKAKRKCILWIGTVLEKEMDTQLRVRLLLMLGECYQGIGDKVKAKQSYNQSFLLTPKIENDGYRKHLQQMIQEKLQGV